MNWNLLQSEAYIILSNNWQKFHFLLFAKQTLENVLQLHVQEDAKDPQNTEDTQDSEDTGKCKVQRKYKHKELQELQSKLMLVAGKAEMGKDDVDRFTIVRYCWSLGIY